MGSYGETVVGIYGIDVGEMQGNINWEQVKKEGVQFAMLRSGYGAGSMYSSGKMQKGAPERKFPLEYTGLLMPGRPGWHGKRRNFA